MKKLFLVILRITSWLEVTFVITATTLMVALGGVAVAIAIFPPANQNQSDIVHIFCRVVVAVIGVGGSAAWISLFRENWKSPTVSAQAAKWIARQPHHR